MRELEAQSRDLPVMGQLKAAVHLFGCGIGLVLVIAGQMMVDMLWPAVNGRIPDRRIPIKVEPARHG